MPSDEREPPRTGIAARALGATPWVWPRLFGLQGGIRLGDTNLLIGQEGGSFDRACMCAAALLLARHPDGGWGLPTVAVVVPGWRGYPPDLRDRVANAVRAHDTGSVAERVELLEAADARLKTLVDLLRALPGRSAAYVTFASDFEPGEMLDCPSAEARRAARLAATLRAVIEVAIERELYVLVDAGCQPLFRPENIAQLHELESLAIYSISGPDDRHAIAQHETRWTDLLSRGAEELVRNELEKLGIEGEGADTTIAALYAAADDHAAAWRLIGARADAVASAIEPAAFVELADWALRAGARSRARALLERFASAQPVTDAGALRRAIHLALRIGDEPLAECLETRASQVYPGAFSRNELRLHHALWAGDYLAARRWARSIKGDGVLPPEVSYERIVAEHLGRDDAAGLAQALRNAGHGDESRVALELMLYHNRKGDFLRTLDMDLPEGASARRRAHAWDLRMSAIEMALKEANSIREPGSGALLVKRLWEAVAFLAEEPPMDAGRRGKRRLRLAQALSKENSGMLGVSLLATWITRGVSARLAVRDEVDVTSVPHEELLELTRAAIEPRSTFRVGEGELPPGYASSPSERLRGLQYRLAQQIQFFAAGADKEEIEPRFASILAHLACLLGRALGDPTSDIRALRTLAAGLLEAGHAQDARHLAEICLELGYDTSGRRARVSWTAFADVYLRNHLVVEAGLALVVALSIGGVELQPDELYDEYSLRARFLRQLGLHGDAVELLKQARAAFEQDERLGRYSHRFQVIEDQMPLLSYRAVSAETLVAILGRARDACNAAREVNDELRPPAQLLGLAIAAARRQHLDTKDHESFFEEVLATLPPGARAHLRMLIDPEVDANALQLYVDRLNSALFAEDVGADASMVRILASRALGGAVRSGDAAVAAFLADISTDHGVTLLHEWDTPASASPRFLTAPEEVTISIASFSKSLDVHLLALTSSRRLVRVSSVNGGPLRATLETKEVFAAGRLEKWARTYPHAFADCDSGASSGCADMREAMHGLGLSIAEPTRVAIFVPGLDLVQIPWQLALVGDGFAGTTAPTATVPSLAWLAAARRVPQRSNGSRVLWIPSHDAGDSDPLRVLAEELQASRSTGGFSMNLESSPPRDLRGSGLAVVGIHGAVDRREPHFLYAADELGRRWSIRELARALAGAEIVALLSCHSGRSDLDVFGGSPVGFARLVLDYGARAVVAPSWPVSVRAMKQWLPVFVEQLDRGATVCEANFRANQQIRRDLSHPVEWLAMHVHGDPEAVLPRV